jgi:hypothetical protein
MEFRSWVEEIIGLNPSRIETSAASSCKYKLLLLLLLLLF